MVDDASWRGIHHGTGLCSGHWDTGSVSLVRKQIGKLHGGLFRVKTSSAGRQRLGHLSKSKAMRCCATCWERQRKRRHGVTRTGGVGMCTWRCVDTRTLLRQRWPETRRLSGCARRDVAQRLETDSQFVEFGSHAGTARYRTWLEEERRPLDLASRSLKREFEITNHGRSFDRRDVWVGLSPPDRLQTSRGRRCKGSKKTRKTTLRSEGTSLLKKSLTEPALLEMPGNRVWT